MLSVRPNMKRPENLAAHFGWKTKTTVNAEKMVIPSEHPGTDGWRVGGCFLLAASAFWKHEGIALQGNTRVPHSSGLLSPDLAVPTDSAAPSKARRGIKTRPP